MSSIQPTADARRSPPNDPRCERLLVAIWKAMDFTRELLNGHTGDDDAEQCDCEFCEDAQGLLYNLKHAECLYRSCMLMDFREAHERMLQEAREHGSEHRMAFWSLGIETMRQAGEPAPKAVLPPAVETAAVANPVEHRQEPKVSPFYSGKVAW